MRKYLLILACCCCGCLHAKPKVNRQMLCSNDAYALYAHTEGEDVKLLLLFGGHYLRGVLIDHDITKLVGDNQEEYKGIVSIDLLKNEAYMGGSVRIGKSSDYLPKLKLMCREMHWGDWYDYDAMLSK